MNFLIANTFTDSLAKLTGNEQKAVKTTVFDLQLNPAQPGMQFHKLAKTKDPKFWSVRVNKDIRIIAHRSQSSLVLCYVDHHDNAYHWAERRKLETHPKTGAAQLVEVRETIQEITVPVYVEREEDTPAKAPLFAKIPDSDLLDYGVPDEWLEEVRNADEDSLLALSDHLPREASEALLELAVGGTPPMVPPVDPTPDPFNHPDAQRRFRLMTNVEELERALNYPWEKWAVFLHPAQREIVEKNYNGPFRVTGSAGTGKTVVAIHRAVFLARANPDTRVLLTTFSDTLADALRSKLKRLIYNEPRLAERVEVDSIDAVGDRLYRTQFGAPKITTPEQIRELLANAIRQAGENRFSLRFLMSEWENVVDAWQLDSWEEYRDIRRLGRKTRLLAEQRIVLWSIFEQVKTDLRNGGLVTRSELFGFVTHKLQDRRHPPFDFAVVDEAQDISVPQLRFLAALGSDRLNSLFFAGDLGQRIFQMPFSWKALGVDVRGRSHTLKINYRTSHQIRQQADLLLGPEVADVDGNAAERRGTISAFNGDPPATHRCESEQDEAEIVSIWLQECRDKGVEVKEIGIFVRSKKELDRACAAAHGAALPYRVLDCGAETSGDSISISTMHLAKGLEFRAVAVMACDDEVLPLQERIETVADDADLEEVYDTERHLLYVACTRARDHLLVTSVEPASEFLDDLQM